MPAHVTKRYSKRITIQGKYTYKIYEVEAGNFTWIEAQPCNKGIVRTADNEQILRIILENDAIQLNKEQQRVR